ncbi:nicotinate (nicotinamide) nucleotide adenylyltransferase [bacterium]|nr:nicotinate (nicotinamide) nucleotide adenylyltransferase [bacterium]
MNCYFFGTFNPIHLGHVEISRQVKALCGFEKVIFVPSFIPPHKNYELAPFNSRYEMACLAVGQENVSDIERKLKVPNYSYRTIEHLYENEKVNFIIGYDQFFKIESWREPDILKEKTHFIVIPRKFQNGQTLSDNAFKYLKNKGFSFDVININFLDVSSSMIRKYLENNQDITGLTTPEVKEYIERYGLYKKMAQGQSVRR